MSGEEKFDVIIVGAGPAGAACGYVLAKAGKNVLMIERGISAGSKNVTGGRLYTYALELLEPGLYAQAPLERKVVREQIMMLAKQSAITIDYLDYGFDQGVPQSYTVLRAPFDEWLAGQAEAQGALVAAGIKVDDLIIRDNKVIGVTAGEDEMYADIVIAADGVNSIMAQKAGLRQDIDQHMVGVGVKEVIELPAEVIEKRFNVGRGQGTARTIVGCTQGVQGGGFLYTNQSSISLGVVLNPASAAKAGKKIHDIMQDFKLHPAIYPLLAEGITVEYGAHLVPEQGWRAVPQKLYCDGLIIVGDAAGFCINTGTIIRGIDLAIVSGVAAARAVLAARDTATAGKGYMAELEKLQLIPTMKLYAGWPELLENPRMFTKYPQAANEMLQFMFAVDGKVPEKLPKAMLSILRQHVSLREVLADAWSGVKAI